MSNKWQVRSDALWNKILIRFLPQSISPNNFTIIRLALIPLLAYFLFHENYLGAVYLFILALLTDGIDGALSRLRHQTSKLGSILDGIADKLLILTLALFAITQYQYSYLIIILISIDVALLLGSGLARIIYPLHTVYKANRYGKAKMVLQGLGLSLILIDAIFKLTIFNWIATVILILAIISGVISFFKYAQNIIKTGNKN